MRHFGAIGDRGWENEGDAAADGPHDKQSREFNSGTGKQIPFRVPDRRVNESDDTLAQLYAWSGIMG
jgi:hypothetical protein